MSAGILYKMVSKGGERKKEKMYARLENEGILWASQFMTLNSPIAPGTSETGDFKRLLAKLTAVLTKFY